jgi:hypothetical protein
MTDQTRNSRQSQPMRGRWRRSFLSKHSAYRCTVGNSAEEVRLGTTDLQAGALENRALATFLPWSTDTSARRSFTTISSGVWAFFRPITAPPGRADPLRLFGLHADRGLGRQHRHPNPRPCPAPPILRAEQRRPVQRQVYRRPRHSLRLHGEARRRPARRVEGHGARARRAAAAATTPARPMWRSAARAVLAWRTERAGRWWT